MSSQVIEVLGKFIEEQPGVFRWEGSEPDPNKVRLWRPKGRYHLLDGTIADQPRLSISGESADEELIGASAIGAVLTLEGFMAAWQGLTREQRREAAQSAGEAACRTIKALASSKARGRRDQVTIMVQPDKGTPSEPQV